MSRHYSNPTVRPHASAPDCLSHSTSDASSVLGRRQAADEVTLAWLSRRRRRTRARCQAPGTPSFHGLLLPRLPGAACGCVALLVLAASPLLARAPSVRFDTAYLVGCRDVTTDEFLAANPHERLVEGRLRVTAIATGGELTEDTQYVYRFLSPTGRLRIVDYQPKTWQSSAVAGNVSVEKKRERNRSLSVSVSGSLEQLARGNGGADIGTKDTSNIHYELKPPMEVILVAGTIERGTGVYFKLRGSPEQSLEGSREFVVVMRVPNSWRGDVMYVRCEAQENRRGKLVSRGVMRFVVGLYAAGDEAARSAAEELVLSEALLRRTAAQQQRAIEKRAVPSLVHKVGALLDMYDPRIPDSWLDRLVFGSTDFEQHEYYKYLPTNVRRVADAYRQAKRRMYQLSGSRLAMRAPTGVSG